MKQIPWRWTVAGAVLAWLVFLALAFAARRNPGALFLRSGTFLLAAVLTVVASELRRR